MSLSQIILLGLVIGTTPLATPRLLVIRPLPWGRSPAWIERWVRSELLERAGVAPAAVDTVLRPNGPRRLSNGDEQLHTGTALVRFTSEADSRQAFELFSSLLAPPLDPSGSGGARLRVELVREEGGLQAPSSAGPARPAGAPRLVAARRREHQRSRRARELDQLDALLAELERSAAQHSLAPEAAPAQSERTIRWEALPPSLDPCRSARRMEPGTLRGERKRLTVEAFALLLHEVLPAALSLPGRGMSAAQPRALTVVDCGCGTGNLLLPLATLAAPGAHFVGVDLKRRSLELLAERVERSADSPAQRPPATGWLGPIDEYDGPCDAVISLHACGGASDAALELAARRRVPYVVSPCCVGKLRRGPRSQWLVRALRRAQAQPGPEHGGGGAEHFAQIAACADASSPGADAPTRLRRRRAKLLVEQDRLAAAREAGSSGCRLVDMGVDGDAPALDASCVPPGALSDEVDPLRSELAPGSALSSSALRHVLVGHFGCL